MAQKEKTGTISNLRFNYSCRTQKGLGNINALSLHYFLGALNSSGLSCKSACTLFEALINKWIGAFYQGGESGRKLRREIGKKRSRRRKERKAKGKEEDLLECLSWPSLHYITGMLPH